MDMDALMYSDGEVESKMLGIYGTFVGTSDFYMDAIIKYQWIDGEFDSRDTAGNAVTANDITTGGFGASLEFGRKLRVKQGADKGWYFEPQVQLSYQRYDGDYYYLSNGLNIGVGGFNSILGRVGLRVGYDTEKTNFYAKASKLKEFDGDMDIYANGVHISDDIDSSWWVYGIGFTSKINAKNNVYLDIERSSGGIFSQDWRVTGGWRVEF